MAKARLEDQQGLKFYKNFSNISINDNKRNKSLDKNKYKFNSKEYNFNNNPKEKIKSPDKFILNNSSINDNIKDFSNMNFPSIYKNLHEIPEFNKNILEKKEMYLSNMKDNLGAINNTVNKDSNKTQIDFNNANENKNINKEKLNPNKNKKNFRMFGSSSGTNLLIKMDSFTPKNMSNPFLNRSNNEERSRSYELNYDKGGSPKATLNHMKSFLVKKFKEDFI